MGQVMGSTVHTTSPREIPAKITFHVTETVARVQ